MQNIKIIEKLQSHHIQQLVSLYKKEFWCNQRQMADVEIMLKNSDIVLGIVDENNNLIGFCRLLTDYCYKATLYDLIIHPQWRSHKLSTQLMDTVINHPELKSIEHIDLNCLPEMVPYYEKWRFTDKVDKIIHMRRYHQQ